MKVTFKDVYTYKSKFNLSPLFLMEKITSILEKKDYIDSVAYKLEQNRLKITIYKDFDKNEYITREQYFEISDEINELEGFRLNEVTPIISGWGELNLSIWLVRA